MFYATEEQVNKAVSSKNKVVSENQGHHSRTFITVHGNQGQMCQSASKEVEMNWNNFKNAFHLPDASSVP
jgi:hypothetical protein